MQEVLAGSDLKKQECFQIFFDSIYFMAVLGRCLSQKRRQVSRLFCADGLRTVMMQIPCQNTDKGRIMMHFAKENTQQGDLPEGVQIRRKNGSVMILPDNEKAFCNVYAHSYSEEYAKQLAVDYQALIDEVVKNKHS